MNQDTFATARQAYAAKDYQNALLLFTSCLQDATVPLQAGEVGLIYHQIGNCLVKLKNGGEAVNAYLQALNDTAYGAVGAVCYNLGTTYSSLRDYEDAAKYFEKAVLDQSYATPYKAYSGLGNAYMKLGKSAEAGIAFREAALDSSNPAPARALMSLGVCFMALNRPEDAVTSYESALQFDADSSLANKINANLGQAYVSAGRMKEAKEAFEKALADKTYFLSDSASVDYQQAIAAVSQGAEQLAVNAQEPAEGAIQDDIIDVDAQDDQGAFIDQYGQPGQYDQYDQYDQTGQYDQYAPYDQNGQYDQYGQNGQYDSYYGDPYGTGQQTAYLGQPVAGDDEYHEQLGQDAFFDRSEEEIEQWARDQQKAARKKKHTGLKVFLVILIILLLLVGGALFGYTQGYGFPTQSSTASQLFDSPSTDSDVFAASVSDTEKADICSLVSTCTSVEVNAVERGMSESTVYVTATTSKGGTVQFKIGMVRDLVGWKVSSVDLFFASQNSTGSSASTTSSTSTGTSSTSGTSSASTGTSSAAASASPAASSANQ